MTYDVENECPLVWSSPDGAMCDGFLHIRSCPAGYSLKYTPENCPEKPPYLNGVNNEDYKHAIKLINWDKKNIIKETWVLMKGPIIISIIMSIIGMLILWI